MNEQPVNALPQGHRIEEYELERVLRAGDFDMTYLASDRNLKATVVLREYLPSEIARRMADNSVAPQEDTFREDFEWGMEQFLAEARTLAQFQHPNIVRVHRSFAGARHGVYGDGVRRGEDVVRGACAAGDVERIGTAGHATAAVGWAGGGA